MAILTGQYINAAGEPCRGYVRLEPQQLNASSSLILGASVGAERVRIPFDEDGAFAAEVEPGDYRLLVVFKQGRALHGFVTVPATDGEVPLASLLAGYTPAEQTAQFTTPGPWSYDIPYWATRVDVVLLGAGGAGANGSMSGNGIGALAGQFNVVTLVRGDNVPWTTRTITGTVGRGATTASGAGTASTAVAAGLLEARTAAGGAGAANGGSGRGIGPGTRTVNGKDYVGGTNTSATPGSNGIAPGGGGAGGSIYVKFGVGANGSVWLRAYQ
jgi:hypothetical protein